MKNKAFARVRVWDLPVRLLHWMLVAAIAGAWISSSRTGAAHEWIGCGAAAVVAARLVWGWCGGVHARFADFVARPAAVVAYLRQIGAGHPRRYLGHNPAGGAMVLALLVCVAAVAASGWAATTDPLWGYAWPVRVHAALAWLLLVLIGLHLAGVALACWQHRENLVAAMVSGDKRSDH